jgi:hypothetical protein
VRRRYLTFEERGVHAGFHSRRIAFVRCRVAKSGGSRFEAVVPNWTGDPHGSCNDLVMPWENLPAWAPVEGYDRALFEQIGREFRRFDGHIDPIMMDEIRMRVELEHGSDEQRERARSDLTIAERDTQRSLLEVVAMFGRHIAGRDHLPDLAGISGQVLYHLADQSPEELKQLVRVIAGSISRGTEVSGQVLRQRLDRVSDFASPICSLVTADPAGAVGYLSRRFGMVEHLHDDLRAFAARQQPEMQEDVGLICANTMTFMLYGHARAEILRRMALEERSYTENAEHEALLRTIASERVRIAFALDGWSAHAEIWQRARSVGETAKQVAISQIMRDMPKPPMEVDAELNRMKGDSVSVTFRGRTVRELHSWANDELDRDLYQRVMAAREGLVTNA